MRPGLCRILVTLTASVAVVVPAVAADGVVMVMKTTVGTTEVTSHVQMEKSRMRAEVIAASGAPQVLVFDGTKQLLLIVNHARKSYVEVTKEELDRLAGQMQALMAQMQGMMANMSPEQRARIEGLMGGRGMVGEATAYKRSGSSKSTKWACDRYDGFKGGTKVTEICTVDPRILGITPADLLVSRQLGEFFQALMPQATDQLVVFGEPAINGFSGVSVRTTTTSGGVTTTVEVTDVRREIIQDSVFVVPDGYQKQSMDFGMGMPGLGR